VRSAPVTPVLLARERAQQSEQALHPGADPHHLLPPPIQPPPVLLFPCLVRCCVDQGAGRFVQEARPLGGHRVCQLAEAPRDLAGRDPAAELRRGLVLQVVRLVHDQVLVLGQHLIAGDDVREQ
jgi:hypothetical protein